MFFVEDTHGVMFHQVLINKLFERNILSGSRPSVRKLPAKKCNQAISRKIRGVLFNEDKWKIVVVIDTERRSFEEALRDITDHFERNELDNMRIVLIEPRHEAWLCIGLGGDKHKCRSTPEDIISKSIGRPYEKYMLGKLAHRIKLQKLLQEKDFKEYIDALNWLIE